MGSIMAPLELDEGYDPNYSAAVNICSAPTGILIPPSGPLILYSITAGGVSVAALFMGGSPARHPDGSVRGWSGCVHRCQEGL